MPFELRFRVCAAFLVLVALLGCEARDPRRATVIEAPTGEPSVGSDGAVSQDAAAAFEKFLYQRPSGAQGLHGFLVSEFAPLKARAKEEIWFAMELFLRSDRSFLLRYSEFEVEKNDGRVTRVDRGARHETVQGSWKVDGQILVLETLGSANLRVKDGKTGVSLLITRNIKSNGLSGQTVFLSYEQSDRGPE